jgi:hypothetical protein
MDAQIVSAALTTWQSIIKHLILAKVLEKNKNIDLNYKMTAKVRL